MAVEVYTEDQEWPIDLPAEPPRDRRLEGRREATEYTWEYSGFAWFGGSARCNGVRYSWSWDEIVAWCLSHSLTLHSLPPGADS